MIKQLADALFKYTEGESYNGPYLTAINGVGILKSSSPKPPIHMVSKPSICIVAQGTKCASFGDVPMTYGAGQALVVGVETPFVGRVFEATPEEPCLVLAMELDLKVLREVAQNLKIPSQAEGSSGRSVFVSNLELPLIECAIRIMRLLETPDAIPTIFPLIMKEICYWLLVGKQGGDILQLAVSPSSQRVLTALHDLRTNYQKPIQIEKLADMAQMSTSAFYRQFKALTSLSPLQYQKEIRLLEARRLMISKNLNAESAAYEVGYESPSQFNREYVRMFGITPKRDITQIFESEDI